MNADRPMEPPISQYQPRKLGRPLQHVVGRKNQKNLSKVRAKQLAFMHTHTQVSPQANHKQIGPSEISR